jgi:regulator of protease activity HflC (stomatin/prohibitin superfamily)
VTALIAAAWSVLSDKLKAVILGVGGFFVGIGLTWLVMSLAYNGLSLPLIGQVIDGKMQLAVNAAREKLVDRAEYDALVAVLARKEIEAQTASAAAAALRSKIIQAEKAKSDAETRLENELAADRDPNRTSPSSADEQWMSKHPYNAPR